MRLARTTVRRHGQAGAIRRACAAALAFAVPLAAVSGQGGAAARPDLTVAAREVIQQTNGFRARNGLGELAPNDALANAAQRFADYMARTERYGHEADGRAPAERVSEAGYAYCLVAENIAFQMSTLGFATDELATRLVDGWQRSPGHRHNMLLAQALDTGVGIARGAQTQRYYAVQLFARPKSASARFEVANRGGATVQYNVDGDSFVLAPRVTRTHQGCFEGTLKVQWPDGSTSAPIRPRDGARYVAARDGEGRWRLDTQ
jgi:uncharacterized protein YkwD